MKNDYVHGDVAWRNVGYFKKGKEIHVVMLDLSAKRVMPIKDSRYSADWVDKAIEHLANRCSVQNE
jgi:hypothetical protein